MTLPRVKHFVASDTLFFHDPVESPRPAWWRALSTSIVALVALGPFLISHTLAPPRAMVWSDKHRNAALEIALNRVLCGTESRLSTSFPVARQLEDHPGLRDVPLRDVALRLAGSASAYCDSVAQPFQGGENSLMLEMTLLLTAFPGLSLRGLGWGLQASRILALALFAFVLLENGVSLLFAAAVLVSAFGILAYLGATAHYSIYPFLPVLLALDAAFLSYCLQRRLWRDGPRHVVSMGLAGWLIAFAANMRSSHLPVHVAFLALYLVVAGRLAHESRAKPTRAGRLRWLGAGVLGAGLCYGLFGLLFIRPLTRDAAGGQASPHHPVAHALVLGLAVPQNDLARREGIEWEDSAGLTLARRIDPNVSYLREGYESALFTYYRRLWTLHPREMLGIYWRKLLIAGRSMISKLSASPVAPLAWPLVWIPNGAAFLALHAALAGLLLVVSRRGSALAFTLALLAAAGLLLRLESALILPVFDMTHHASQLFCFLVFALLAWQLPLEALRRVVRRARAGRS